MREHKVKEDCPSSLVFLANDASGGGIFIWLVMGGFVHVGTYLGSCLMVGLPLQQQERGEIQVLFPHVFL